MAANSKEIDRVIGILVTKAIEVARRKKHDAQQKTMEEQNNVRSSM